MNKSRLFFIVLIFPVIGSTLGAEQIYTRSGQVLNGTVTTQDPQSVGLEIDGRYRTYNKSDLRRIVYSMTDEEVRKLEEAKKAEELRQENLKKDQQRQAELARQRNEEERKNAENRRLEAERKSAEAAQKLEADRKAAVDTARLEDERKTRELADFREKTRLIRARGVIHLTGGQDITGEVLEKRGEFLKVKTRYGELALQVSEIGYMVVDTGSGTERIRPADIRGIRELELEQEEIRLTSGNTLTGRITGAYGESVLASTNRGSLLLHRTGVLSALPNAQLPNTAELNEGESGTIVLAGDQKMRGTIVLRSPHMIIVDTPKGRLILQRDQILYTYSGD